jgi:hypothetical protein
VSPYGSLWAAAAHHRRQPEDARSGALAAETTNLRVGPLRPLMMRMLHDEGMQPEATSNGLPGHVEQAKSQAGGGPVPLGLGGTLSGGPAAPCADDCAYQHSPLSGHSRRSERGFVGATGFEPATARL